MKKTKLTRSLLAACSIVALTAVMYGCVHDGGEETATDETDMEMGPTEAEQIAELQRQINALRAQLGLGPDDSLGDSISDLQAKARDLQERIDGADVEMKEGLFAAIMKNVDGVANTDDGDPGAGFSAFDKDATVKPKMSDPRDNKGSDDTIAFAKHYGDQVTAGVLAVTDGVEKGARSDRFPKNGGTVTYADTADNDIPDSAELSGSLMGALGTFRCTAGTCTITEDAGEYEFSADWTFHPNDGAMVTIPDGDYIRWGWWAFERKDGTYRVETYATYSKAADDISVAPTNLSGLGTATYMGSAVGKYAIDNRPTGTTLDAGHFEANATLKADFDGGSVTGTIDSFMVDGESRKWSVALGKTSLDWGDAAADPVVRDIDTSNDTADPATGIAGPGVNNVWTIDGVKGNADGDWSADFHHDGDPRNDGTPASVVGQFTASHGTNAYMVGAFGAENMAADTPSTE